MIRPNDAHVWLARAAGNDFLAAYMYACEIARNWGDDVNCMLWHSAHCQLAMALGGDLDFRDRKEFTKEALVELIKRFPPEL